MSKYGAVLKYFIENPIFFTAFFFSIFPFWVLLVWYFNSKANAVVLILALAIIVSGKCIVKSELQNKNPFYILINELVNSSFYLISNILFVIWLIFLIIMIIFLSDTVLKITAVLLVFMSFIFMFTLNKNNYLKDIWQIEGLKKNSESIRKFTIFLFWLIVLYSDFNKIKYTGIVFILYLEFIGFIKKYESVI